MPRHLFSLNRLPLSAGARRSWLRGLKEVGKRYLIAVAAHNLGRNLWKLFGVGKPKSLQALRAPVQLLIRRRIAVLALSKVTWRVSSWLAFRSLQIRPSAQNGVMNLPMVKRPGLRRGR